MLTERFGARKQTGWVVRQGGVSLRSARRGRPTSEDLCPELRVRLRVGLRQELAPVLEHRHEDHVAAAPTEDGPGEEPERPGEERARGAPADGAADLHHVVLCG